MNDQLTNPKIGEAESFPANYTYVSVCVIQ